MCKLYLSFPVEIEKDGSFIFLNKSVYNITDERVAKENGFFKCSVCKNYFDIINEVGQYNPYFEKYKDKNFCNTCYPKEAADSLE